ncbi:MAG TPA: extensin family protein [Beijerinckiaceae bacterium]|jgi:hypothetical protein|nr:extensin family protein [Beijerinckiaceae bacterium]
MKPRAAAVLALGALVLSPISCPASFSAAARAYRALDYPHPAHSARPRQGIGRPSRALRPTAVSVPLPPRRPPEFAAPKEPGAEAAPIEVAAPPPPPGDDVETCAAILASGNVVASRQPPMHSGFCRIENPLMLEAIVLADKKHIPLEPPVAMRCRLAGAIAQWIIEDVAPAVAASGQPLAALSGVGGYECRGRNGVAGAKLSEHAIGNAMDIAGLKLADGKIISVQQNDMPVLFEKIRASACARFSTVLGPGADASHKTHLHVDLQERRHGYKMCQWDVAPSKAAPAASAKKN